MTATIFPSSISGTIRIHPSKSVMQRALALALLHNGTSVILNSGSSSDELAAIKIIHALGAEVKGENEKLIIKSRGIIKGNTTIDCHESGLACRMFAPISALASGPVNIIAGGTLLKRSMSKLHEIFGQLQVEIKSTDGFLPLTVTGPLQPQDISIDGSETSQYLTGLLLALAKSATLPVIIKVSNLKSKPYINITLEMMRQFGYKVEHHDYENFYIKPLIQIPGTISCTIESDWSSASFLLVAGAIAGSVMIEGLNLKSVQGDSAILDILRGCGAEIDLNDEKIFITAAALQAFQFDATDCPDLFPPLVALAANCVGISTIKGATRLRQKESNRAESICDLFTKMGVTIILENDLMFITGTDAIQSANVESHSDHRIVMAAAIAALNASGPITITGSEAIDKSYPDFFMHLQTLGAAISLHQ